MPSRCINWLNHTDNSPNVIDDGRQCGVDNHNHNMTTTEQQSSTGDATLTPTPTFLFSESDSFPLSPHVQKQPHNSLLTTTQ
ncbi:hypothetical protein OG21DRAFT_1484894 [Imleria badia]|nr:hypothetical protein OG21DRAFT_1484894 [Imleria badia]